MYEEVVADIAVMASDELVERLRSLERERRRSEAELSLVVGALERSGAYRADGHVSVRGLLRAEVNWSEGDITICLREARLAADAPVVGEALWTGQIGVAQARMLARVRANPRCGALLADHVGDLVGIAGRLPYEDFALCARRWEQLADTDGAHRRAETVHNERTASFTEHDGIGHLSATGGALDTVEMREIWQRYCDAEFTADWEATTAKYGDTASALLMPRTDAQRRWDALKQVFLDAASRPAEVQRPEPVVNIVMDAVTFETTLARMRLINLPDRGPMRRIDKLPVEQWRCETTSGVLVDPVAAVVAALHGHVRRVVFDSVGNVIDLGRRRRLFTGAAREAVRLQAPRCIWPGCHIPAGRCQSDHLDEWQHDGPTSPDNGAPLCGRHNRWKTRGYRLWRDPEGLWHTTRPDGTHIGHPAA